MRFLDTLIIALLASIEGRLQTALHVKQPVYTSDILENSRECDRIVHYSPYLHGSLVIG